MCVAVCVCVCVYGCVQLPECVILCHRTMILVLCLFLFFFNFYFSGVWTVALALRFSWLRGGQRAPRLHNGLRVVCVVVSGTSDSPRLACRHHSVCAGSFLGLSRPYLFLVWATGVLFGLVSRVFFFSIQYIRFTV